MKDTAHEANVIRVWFRLLRLQARFSVAIADRLIAAYDNAATLPPITAETPEFSVADGYIIIATGNDSQYQKLCGVLGTPELAGATPEPPQAARKAMSWATRLRATGSGSSMKLPPYFTTKVEPRKSWM